MKRSPGAFCPYCGEWMTRRGRNRARSATRDHICPQAWGGPDIAENRRIVCRQCNGDRALAGHCIAALACARAVAQSTGATAEQVLRYWRLPRLRQWGLWMRVHRAAHLWSA